MLSEGALHHVGLRAIDSLVAVQAHLNLPVPELVFLEQLLHGCPGWRLACPRNPALPFEHDLAEPRGDEDVLVDHAGKLQRRDRIDDPADVHSSFGMSQMSSSEVSGAGCNQTPALVTTPRFDWVNICVQSGP